jgi:hypothetical protein|tara:strand:+ start:1023 stop:1757 length:735 start_codon:yes stop_codon:yes gene_type:complete
VADVTLWAKRLSGASLLLLLIGVVSYYNAMPAMFDELDPSQRHILELESGESGEVNLDQLGEYVALRVTGEDSQSAELRLIDAMGSEESGSAPSGLDLERPGEDGTLYVPVRVFRSAQAGDYTLHNDGNTTLWFVDDTSAQKALFGHGWFVMMFFGCCLGIPLGVVALILVLAGRGQRKKTGEPMVVSKEGMLPTTDELYRQYRGLPETEKEGAVADPFPGQTKVAEESQKAEEDQDWWAWDEG